ncbi:hypothetical protein RA086_01170 [Lactiplantibacillus sp. WILCCON 0030]|uniref:Extracellular protein n=1 Tax=Lactiplantibacillus brownii TaxID=3069269 RepID=A0ABU1A5L7_9LACO|nr:hypothetical protein [Lactiplantibacillus brownii]MDQ7936261.1 hypothetical protein [Lactiplantibacillus brownii]
MKNTLKKLTITIMAAGTLFATTGTAMADTTTTTTTQASTTLVRRVNHGTNLATRTAKPKPADDLTPHATKLVAKGTQTQVLETIDASSQNLDKLKYQPTK